jgi:Fe2+ or Zn2+ uptake regulation protein
MTEQPDLWVIVAALAIYLQANPHACDTAEGIHRWWFPPNVELTLDAVSRALAWMERQNLVEVTTAVDGHQRFRRCASDEELAIVVRSLADGPPVC